MERIIRAKHLAQYERHLRNEEMAQATIENYLRHASAFTAFAAGRSVTKKLTAAWKEHIREQDYAVSTVNAMLVSLNSFLKFMGWTECRVKLLRVQKQLFRDENRDLTREEYDRLIMVAQGRGKERLALVMETICATGIRVSELQYVTVETVTKGQAEISLKGKIRVIMFPGKLSRKLLKYAKRNHITTGAIFITNRGSALSRRQIWMEMKELCREAGVEASKVFPHNLRHLFAVTFYKACRDIAHLADLLGHSSVNTTRIYLISTGEEHRRQLDRLGLVS